MNDLFYVLVSIMGRKKNKENDRLRNRYDGKKGGRRKKVVLVVRLIDRRVSCVYVRPMKKKEKSIYYAFCKSSTMCNGRTHETKQNKHDIFD